MEVVGLWTADEKIPKSHSLSHVPEPPRPPIITTSPSEGRDRVRRPLAVLARHHLNDCLAEVRQIIWFSAAYEVAIHDHRGILPNRPGVHQIVLDAWRSGKAIH